jgi:histidyl-tRNA synthetase
MGGPDTPAIGFAAGIERIAMMRGYAPEAPRSVYIIPVSSECTDYAIDLTNKLRMQNIHTILDLQGKVPKRLQRAVEKNAKFAVFIGSEEMASGKFKLKDLDSKTESELPLEQLIKAVTDLK